MPVLPWPKRGGARSAPGPPEPAPASPAAPGPADPSDAAAWADAETHVDVRRVQGFLCKVSVHARVNCPPAGVYAILTQPDNSGVFRAIEAMPYRHVLAADPAVPGRRTVEVEHVARWRAGPLLSGTLSTRLLVEEDPSTGTVTFRLAPGGPKGFMAAFEGEWRIAPMTQAALDALLAAQRQQGGGSGGGGGAAAAGAPVPPAKDDGSSRVTVAGWPWGLAEAALARVASVLPGSGGGATSASTAAASPPYSRAHPLPSTGASLVTLTQSVGPRLHIPPPIDRLVTLICARQVKGLLTDLRAEAARRRHRAAGEWADGGAEGLGEPPPLPPPPPPRARGSSGRGRELLW